MTALSDQFIVLDKLRKAAGIKPDAWCRRAGVIWLRYLKFRSNVPFKWNENPFPTEAELAALERALRTFPDQNFAELQPLRREGPAALSSPQTPVTARPESISSSRRD